jgi:hypothetical protein
MSELELLFDQHHIRNTILIYLVNRRVDDDLFSRMFPEWPSDRNELCKQLPISALRCTSRRLSNLPYPVYYCPRRKDYYPSAYYSPPSHASIDYYKIGFFPCPLPILMLEHDLSDYAMRTFNAPLDIEDRIFSYRDKDFLGKLLIYFGTPDSFQILYDGPNINISEANRLTQNKDSYL